MGRLIVDSRKLPENSYYKAFNRKERIALNKYGFCQSQTSQILEDASFLVGGGIAVKLLSKVSKLPMTGNLLKEMGSKIGAFSGGAIYYNIHSQTNSICDRLVPEAVPLKERYKNTPRVFPPQTPPSGKVKP